MIRNFNLFSIGVAVISLFPACRSKQPSPAVLEFVKQLDGKSLDEARDMLKEENEKVTSFIHFMKNFEDEKPQHFKPGEEKEGIPFSVPDTAQLETAYKLSVSDIGFNQTYYPTYSLLEPDGASLRKSSLDNPVFTTREIYFHDGTKKSEELELDGFKRLNTFKTVDSALVEANYSYPLKTAAFELDRQHDKTSFKGSSLKVVHIKDNCVRVAMEKEAYQSYLDMEAFNKEGKLLDRTSYHKGPDGDGNVDKLLKDYSEVVEEILKKLEQGAYKDMIALKKDILDKMPGVTPFDEIEKGYVEVYFKGNVDKIKVYLEDGSKKVTVPLMLHNLEPNYTGMVLVEDEASNKFGFIATATGKMAIPFNYVKMRQITPWYFVSGDAAARQFYRLDTAARQLVPVKEFISALSASLVKVAHNDESNKYGVMTVTGEMLLPMEFDQVSIDPATNLIFANKSVEDGPVAGITTIYDNTGKVVTGPYKIIDNFTNGLLLVTDKDGNNFFINPKGTKVIDLKGYFNIAPFKEGLALMENKDWKYGFLDTYGKVAIPFEYSSATPFNLGLSLVTRKNNDVEEAALINTSGVPVVPFRVSSENSADGEGAAMEYTLQKKKFDAWGKEKN